MKLFLTSTIKRDNVIAAMSDFVGGFENKSLIYVPTAANSEEGFGKWKTGETYNLMLTLSPNLKIMELEFTEDSDAQKLVKGADILFLAGGFPGYLSYWIHRRKLVNTIKSCLDEGMILIGTSAGAMVCAETVKLSGLYEDDPFTDIVPGMGLIDYEIWPHYKEEDKMVIDKAFPGLKVKFLKDGEFIIISD